MKHCGPVPSEFILRQNRVPIDAQLDTNLVAVERHASVINNSTREFTAVARDGSVDTATLELLAA